MIPPDPTASFDQMGALLRSAASSLGSYRDGLLEAGLEPGVADQITADFASKMHAVMCPPVNPFSGLLGKP